MELRHLLSAALVGATVTLSLAHPAKAAASKIFRLNHGAIPAPVPFSPAGPGDKLQYYGGRVLSNVKIVGVSAGA